MKRIIMITATCLLILGLNSPIYAFTTIGNNNCYTCHNGTMAPPVQAPAQPDHTSFGTDCMVCHAKNGWVLTDPNASTEVDADGDGVVEGEDCNDNDATIYPDAQEVPYDGIDQDCDGSDLNDVDQDGYPFKDEYGEVYDCDDQNADINPGATEIIDNGVDENCDGVAEVTQPKDEDQDGSFEDVDCNDDDATIYPGAVEVPYDGIDQDCDGSDLDDVDQDGFAWKDVDGKVVDCNDEDAAINPNAMEIKDNDIDENCDGIVATTDPVDQDGDGYLDDDCNDNDAAIYPGAEEVPYDGIDQDCDGSDLDDSDHDGYPWKDVDGNVVDCNDQNPSINPGAEEISGNDVDENCDGTVAGDEQLVDNDGDGYPGLDEETGQAIDCNDDDPLINPAADEICDDGIDNDCDGRIDDADRNDCPVDPTPVIPTPTPEDPAPEDPIEGPGGCRDSVYPLPGQQKDDGTLTVTCRNFPDSAVAVKVILYPAKTRVRPGLLTPAPGAEGIAIFKTDGSSATLVSTKHRKQPAMISGGRHVALMKVYYAKKFNDTVRLHGTLASARVVIDGDTTLELDFYDLMFD